MMITSENMVVKNVHLRAYMIDQTFRFPQQIAHETSGLFLFDRAEYRSAIPGSERAVEELARPAELIIVIHKGWCFAKANQVGCHR